MELTKEQFTQEIETLNEKETLFNVESVDSGTVYLSLYGCKVETTLEEGICGEIVMFKPFSSMEARIDFDIVDAITKEEDGSFCLELSNGLSDVVIGVAE